MCASYSQSAIEIERESTQRPRVRLDVPEKFLWRSWITP